MEQEYTIIIKEVKPFINYLESNNYILIEESNQKRIIYKKEDNTMLRITIKEMNNKIIKELDFKEDKLNNDNYIERKESKKLVFEDDEVIKSFIDFLNYKKDIELTRKRTVYEKEKVIVEIDEYVNPYKNIVFSIEGDALKAKILYNDINNKLIEYIVKEK